MNIMRKHLQLEQKSAFGLFMYDVNSGPKLSFTFPGSHMGAITVNDA